MPLFDRIADLPVQIEEYDLETRERETSSDFTRRSTIVALYGDGHTGYGEDVTYDADEHDALSAWDGTFPIEGTHTIATVSTALGEIDLFPAGAPDRGIFRSYRRWAFESAVLDLALKQADTHFAAALDHEYDPVRFVVSSKLEDPPTADRVRRWLDIDADLEFKLDASPAWSDRLVDELATTDSVRIIDLKGQYEGTDVETEADPDLYRRVAEGFPDGLIEDPGLTEETRAILDPVSNRVTWDSPITDAASIDDLPWEPDWLNIKPSRFGSLDSLLAFVERCLEADIRLYGGGQFELGVGREHLHALASCFYPASPNDVAPRGYNDPEPRGGLPSSPLPPPENPVGFRWRSASL